MTAPTSHSSYWQTGKTLSECFDYIFTSGTACDVTFLVGEDNERISAHKLVLISRSPVFYAMFEGLLAEKGEVTIPDICYDIFRLFLRYLYTDTIDLTEENAIPVLNAARKYGVDILVSHCEKFLNKTFSEHNVCTILEHAHMFMLENLQKDCLRWIDKHPKTILHSTFADLCRGCVTSITESEDILADEHDVYTVVVNWAEAECKRKQLEITPDSKRNVLGDILYNVRFPVMDIDVFQRKVCHDQILSGEEVVQTINYQLHHVKVSGSKLKFSERRNNMTKRLWRVEGIVESEWDIGKETVSFSVSDNLNLVGFGSFYSQGDNTVNVVIYDGSNVIYKADGISRAKSESDDIGEVLLTGRDRIQLKPDKVYTIVEHTYYKRKCHGRLVSTEQLKFKNTDIAFENAGVRIINALGHNRRQVPYLLLKSNLHK